MAAVSNTSPISNLALIGRLQLLRSQFGVVSIPHAVWTELRAMRVPKALEEIDLAVQQGWLRIVEIASRAFAVSLQEDLDLGEAEAIALASELNTDTLLMDEKEGRRVARLRGLRVTGVLGVLIRAKALGEIVAIKPEIAQLRNCARFFIGGSLAIVIEQAGE